MEIYKKETGLDLIEYFENEIVLKKFDPFEVNLKKQNVL